MSNTRLDSWHKVVANKDMELLKTLLHPEMEFHSPTFWGAKEGGHVAHFILSQVLDIFQNFEYHREFVQDNDMALEFSCKIDDKNLKGIDLIKWNDEGKIIHFEVLIRPLNGLAQLADEMTRRFKAAGFLK